MEELNPWLKSVMREGAACLLDRIEVQNILELVFMKTARASPCWDRAPDPAPAHSHDHGGV